MKGHAGAAEIPRPPGALDAGAALSDTDGGRVTRIGRLKTSTLWGPHSAQRSVGSVFVIVSVAAVLQLATQTFLARALSKPEVGIISLIVGALPLLSAVSLLGQDSATVRFLTRVEPRGYDVSAHVRKTLCRVVPVGLAAGVIGAIIYDLRVLAIVCLVVLVASQNAITIITTVIRSMRRYEFAAAATRLPAIVVSVLLGAAYLGGAITLPRAMVIFIVGFAGTALWIVLGSRSLLAKGDQVVPSGVFREGFFFLATGLALPVMIALDKLIIGKMMGYSDLAVYATVFAVMKGFDFLFYSVSYVMLPHVNTMRVVRLARMNTAIAAVAIVVAALYLALGRPAIHVLFSGQYDGGAYLILPFAVAGIIKLLYAVPSSVIGARLPRSSLRTFMWFSLLSIAVNVVLDVVLIRVWGLLGAACATAIAWALRLAGSYVIILANRDHLSRSSEVS